MLKPKKLVPNVMVELSLVEDPDECQLLDECDKQWVKAWKAVAEKSTKLKPQIACQIKHS
jgi:hypothetical protein